MRILALDTAWDFPAVALLVGDRPVATAEPRAARRHGRDLLPAIRDLLREAAMGVADLDVIGVGIGPGSYTGLRIGLTAARILAYVAKADLVGFDSLEAVAAAAPSEFLRVVAVADAQRGDVYTADFRRETAGGPLVAVAASRIEPLEFWAAHLDPAAVVTGPGLASGRISALIPARNAVAKTADPEPRSRTLIELVLRLWKSGRRDDLWTLEPNYLRRSAAEDQWDARARS